MNNTGIVNLIRQLVAISAAIKSLGKNSSPDTRYDLCASRFAYIQEIREWWIEPQVRKNEYRAGTSSARRSQIQFLCRKFGIDGKMACRLV